MGTERNLLRNFFWIIAYLGKYRFGKSETDLASSLLSDFLIGFGKYTAQI